jgi:hypothetical protein
MACERDEATQGFVREGMIGDWGNGRQLAE